MEDLSRRVGERLKQARAVLVTAVIYVLVNSCVDLSYGFLDPRTRRVHA